MNQENRKQIYESQTAKLYEAIGRFVVDFELLCWGMRTGVTMLLSKAGLKNQQYSAILTAELTADPLRSIYQAVIAETMRPMSQSDQKICDDIFKRIQALIKVRNDVVHGTWLIGWAGPEDTDFSVAERHKPARGKGGAEIRSVQFTAEDVLVLARTCTDLYEAVNALYGFIVSGLSLSKNFVQDDSGNYFLRKL